MDEQWSSCVTLYVNGRREVLGASELCEGVRTTLLQHLRRRGLTGTKLGCGEGGCGACTVMLSWFDENSRTIRHAAANACLAPVCALDGYHVTTVEGIGGMKQGLHPVQQRLATAHGSQCGFCTPGIVMSIYTILRSKPDANAAEIEESLDGNLCRCTGYRPILDAAKSLSKSGVCGVSCPCVQGGNGCGANGGGCNDCATAEDFTADHESQAEGVIHSTTEGYIKKQHHHEAALQASGLCEPIFPPALMQYRPANIRIEREGINFYQPTSLDMLLQLKLQFPQARLVVGNTEVQIETKFKQLRYDVIINPSRVPELRIFDVTAEGLRVGASVTVNALMHNIEALEDQKEIPAFKLRGLVAIRQMLRWFASNQIRNVASVAGNIATASPISDLNPMLQACNATLKMVSVGSTRDVAVREFFLSYRKTDTREGEIIESVFIPFTQEFEFVMPSKQARRREDDISIVTSGMRIKLAPEVTETSTCWRINDISLSFGGMAPTTICAKRTEETLKYQPWNRDSLNSAIQTVREELSLPANVPGGQAEYRQALAASFLFRFFIKTSLQLHELAEISGSSSTLPPVPIVPQSDCSGADGFLTLPKPPTRGEQSYSLCEGGLQKARPVPHTSTADRDRGPVGKSVMHKSALLQVSGEALYTDDMRCSDALHAALVMSTKAHARVISIDTSALDGLPGFEGIYTASDVTGCNKIGAVVKDEECFATDTVYHVGQVIAVVVATSHERAWDLARMVRVVYEDLPALFSIDDAIRAGSFFNDHHVITSGDLLREEASSDVVVEGSVSVGGQEHFYLETNCTLVVPSDNGQMEIYSSTQNPTKTQNFCAYVCGLPATHVTCHVKRMGGGFGGKETRSVFIACAVALAAHLTGRPVRINIERDVDMCITGQRHAFKATYRAGASRDGLLKFLDCDLYNNAGFSLDLSGAVMDRALFHCDNVYRWPALVCRGHICKTNVPSNTAFRGFGGPQGLMVSEVVVEHLATVLNMDPVELRQRNFYQEGDRTHFGQLIENFHVSRCWEELLSKCDYTSRASEVTKFNAVNRYKKRGIFCTPTKFGINFTAKFMNQGGALVHVYTDGTVLVSHGGTEMGQGLHTKVIQVAARAFGIPDSQVHIAETSTDKVPNSSPTAASMSTDLYGMATLDACEQIVERLRPIAEKMPGADFSSIVQTAYFERVNLSAQGFYAVPTERCGYNWDLSTTNNWERGMPFNYFTQGVACTEVEVDVLTGDSRIRRADVVMDVGSSINPAIDIGQIEGAFIQGFGWSTMEELVWGDSDHPWVRPGQLFTRGPGTYKIPAFNDVPEDFRVHLLHENDNPFCVHSSKAVGEPPFFLGASAHFAIKEAIKSARADNGKTDWYCLQLPATSERVRMAIGDELSLMFTQHNDQFQPRGSF